ncbi:amino acid ABC transporter permease [Brucella pituitosa]|uniref:amino acid ABC transporter permease n=1 Tax=Brucella pituitosa TaxID=571256 RepID=UPI002005F520|nr:amino acid ABC transporter permease [Brucella pituitosa]MCK4207668.1 amino acid ABC transporter permease [Brucella pituitosa]
MTSAIQLAQSTKLAPMKVVPARNRLQSAMAGLLIVAVGGLAYLVFKSPNVQWSAIPGYLFDPTIMAGVRLTLLFTVLSMLVALVFGTIVALMKQASNPVLRGFANFYIWVFRGTPLLVQIIFWFNIQIFIPSIGFGDYQVATNSVVTAFVAALLALSLNETAYMAEIIRGGLISVDIGQREAAAALGYRPSQIGTRIVLPQALRIVTPAIGNQTISMLKTTSLVSIVAAQDLLTRVQNIYAVNFLIVELLIVASIWYLLMTTIASTIQFFIERRLGQAALGAQNEPNPFAKWFRKGGEAY